MRPSLIAVLLPLLAAPAVASAQPSTAAKVLLDQANYWLTQNQPAQAEAALQRLLRLDPGNADALALQVQLRAAQGDRSGAQSSLAALRQVRPDDPRIPGLEQAERAGAIDQAGLAEARQLAQAGKPAEAVAKYQRVFRGAPPPGPLAVEYFQTLAATQGGWEPARDGLAQLAGTGDARAELAYAELLTYRPQSRADGIARLAKLAGNSAVATAAMKSWRQALEWLPVDTPSIPAYQAYLAEHPDQAIAQRLAAARNPPRAPADLAAKRRSDAFAALNAGRLAEAEQGFQAALQVNGDDADALGGMGLLRLRQGRNDDARDYLGRAIAADPAQKARWEQALAGASVGEDYARARAMIQRGQLDAAERQLRGIIARGGEVAGAQAMLADVQARRGDLAGAERNYRAALARQPGNADLLVGLAQLLTKQGKDAEAEPLLARAEGTGNRSAVGRMRADVLRQRAARLSDPAQKAALLQAAVAADPADPWSKLDLARALRASGQDIEARSMMAPLAEARTTDSLRAAALFAAEDGRPQDASSIIARLPAAARGPDLQALLAQARVQADIRAAMALAATSPMLARQKLLTLAAAPDPDGGRGVAIARAFAELHDPAGARQALATAQAASGSPTPAQRLAYAGALLGLGDDAGARLMLASLDGSAGLSAAEGAALERLRAGLAVRASDALNAEGRPAEAYDRLAPALAQAPDDPALNLALARLYEGARNPKQALAIGLAVLARDPGDVAARRAAVTAAIQARDFDRAETLVREGMQLAPNDPAIWQAAADLAQARGNPRRALQDLRQARTLRAQQVGEQPLTVATMSAPPTVPGGNPFRHAQAVLVADAGPAARGDAALAEIDRQSASLRAQVAPQLNLGPSLRQRSGTAGLDRLSEISTPMQVLFAPFGRGRATLSATPTFLSAGEIPGDAKSQAGFGTQAFGAKPMPRSQHAEGVGFDAAYDLGWARADIGSTPVGFPIQNIVGGLELAPDLGDGVRLRVRGERRAVTDSVLSYAGTRDTTNRTLWGGVTRSGGHGQLEFSAGEANFYVGGGWASLTGRGVAPNTEIEGGAGGSYPIWRSGPEEVRLGLDLVYFGYDKNLRYFSLGHGGYFSPQSYYAALVPVSYTVKGEKLNWSVGGAIGYQSYHENGAPVFPNDARLQSVLEQQGGGPTGLTSYPSKNAAGISGSATGSLEYRVSPALLFGGRASFQHAGDWSEFAGTVYARYIFNGDL